jgi:lincosamide nucleotidyltransferase A/C/D/E
MFWIDGGWAVDALLGKETRPHEDLDIAIQHADIPKLREMLGSRGYKDVARDDTSENNFVLGDVEGRHVDVHSIEGLAYPEGSLAGQGTIAGQRVRCISAEWLVKFKNPYVDKEKNRIDIAALREKFEI